MNNILVTGTYGFIGSHFLKLLVDHGYEPVGLGRRTTVGDKRRLEDIDKDKFKDYEGDICDKVLIEKIIKENEIDAIVNFGASTHVDNSIKDSTEFIQSNYVGVHNLLEIIRKNYKDIRFLQISTDEVYGSKKEGSFKETDRLNPSNPYSSSKAGSDLLCTSYVNTYNLDIVITRSCNNLGEWQDIEKFIPRCITRGIKGYNLQIYGDGNNIRQWIDVRDNCDAIKLVMDKGKSGSIYNIGTDCYKTNNHVAQIVSERFKVPIEYITDRLGHDFRYSVEYDKINKLGWRPKHSFDKTLERTIEFYKSENYTY